MKEEWFPHPGKPLHQWGDQVEQKGSFRDSEECSSEFAIAQKSVLPPFIPQSKMCIH